MPTAQRKFELVPTIELEKAILGVLREGVSVGPDDAMSAAIDQMGFKRLTGPIRQRLEDIISFLIEEGKVQQRNGRLQLHQSTTITD